MVAGATDDPAQLRTAGTLPASGYGAVTSTTSPASTNDADRIAEIVRRVLVELKVTNR
jgi:hypothetical protein